MKNNRSSFQQMQVDFLSLRSKPSDYLEHCIERIYALEKDVCAWVSLRINEARIEAQASDARYKSRKPLSSIDGMPVGIKDVIKTSELPTYEGFSKNRFLADYVDAPCIQALKKAGALIIGKTTTTELAGGDPTATKNPFDLTRTPGGSSSGSAAAVGAGMVPAAVGTQVAGSILRPSGYCNNFGFKPTFGLINRGDDSYYSQSCIGFHASDLNDLWNILYEVSQFSGVDPGYFGPDLASNKISSSKPIKIYDVKGIGWHQTDIKARDAYLNIIKQVRDLNIDVVCSENSDLVRDFEAQWKEITGLTVTILAYEARWHYENKEQNGLKLSPYNQEMLRKSKEISTAEYRSALTVRQRMRKQFESISCSSSLFMCPANTGVAPLLNRKASTGGMESVATGNPVYNLVPSFLGSPAITIPLIQVDKLPVGLQLFSFAGMDQDIFTMSRWICEYVAHVSQPD